jgi:hypothetical protein
VAVPEAGTIIFPKASTSAVEFAPITLSVFVRFVVSAMSAKFRTPDIPPKHLGKSTYLRT